jgi:hypothetical protein
MNRRMQRCFAGATWSLLAAVLLSACHTDPAGHTAADAGPKSTLVLTRVGAGALTVHPGEPFTLQALLSLTQHGPVPNSAVNWKLTEAPGQIAISDATSNTNDSGIAQTSVTCTDPGQYALRADAADAASKAVWKVACEPVRKHLRIVATPHVTIADAPTGAQAVASMVIKGNLTLTVKVTQEAGDQEIALVGQKVRFQLGSAVAGASFTSGSSQSYVDALSATTGQAVAPFLVGSTTGLDKVIAQLDSNDAPPVEFDVNVTLTDTTGQCMSSADCGGGTCDLSNHTCVGTGGGGSCGSSDTPCPIGYECDKTAGQCKPIQISTCDSCPTGFHCDTTTNMCTKNDPECTTDANCPNGHCRNGVCTPDQAGPVIDVTGHWYTKHNFNVHDALPGWVQFSSTAIRTIDQVLLGQLNLPSWVNAIIRGIVTQYIPPWVQQVVYILDNVLTLFSNLRAEGEMDLTAVGGNNALLAGQEYWSSFVFYLLSQCGQNIGGNPSMPPPCARIDVYQTDLMAQGVDLAAVVDPFTAKVIGSGSGPFTLVVDRRNVHLKLAGLIKYVLDQVISVTTGYPSLEGPPGHPEEGALYNLIDCNGVNQFVQSIIPIDVTALCQAAVTIAAQAIAQQLQSIVVSTDVLSFAGQASARPDPAGDPLYATELGYPDFDTRSPADGIWNGRFSIGVSLSNVPGAWRASRDPIPPQ